MHQFLTPKRHSAIPCGIQGGKPRSGEARSKDPVGLSKGTPAAFNAACALGLLALWAKNWRLPNSGLWDRYYQKLANVKKHQSETPMASLSKVPASCPAAAPRPARMAFPGVWPARHSIHAHRPKAPSAAPNMVPTKGKGIKNVPVIAPAIPPASAPNAPPPASPGAACSFGAGHPFQDLTERGDPGCNP